MEIIRGIENIKDEHKGATVALGNFDGVHIGHQEIIKTANSISRETKTKSAILTFHPHPLSIIKPDIESKSISSLEEKLQKLEGLGIDQVFIVDFTKEFSKVSAENFIEDILLGRLEASYIVTGYNFYFGNKRSGDYRLLSRFSKKYSYKYKRVDQIVFDNHEASSSNVKRLLQDGNIITANSILGGRFAIKGKVIEGKKLAAKKLGVPTANIALEEARVYPRYGVYAVKSELNGKEHYGIANVGTKPTVKGVQPLLEVFFFDYDGNLYDKELVVEFLLFIRPERKFDDLEQLASQIKWDIENAKYAIKNLDYHFRDVQ